jgi:hypothetical protein
MVAKKSTRAKPAVKGGARVAKAVADMAAANQQRGETPAPSILHLAHDAVNGDRADNYGDQFTNFTNIADRMTITLREKLVEPITPQEVALLMLDVKIARLTKTGGRHRDSVIDVAGYAECLDQVNQAEAKNN